jgi:LVIVD repeat
MLEETKRTMTTDAGRRPCGSRRYKESFMSVAFSTRVTVLAALLVVAGTATLRAEIRSKSKEIIVVEPKDLPEQAQDGGNSFFLFSDSQGSTYLYVEQQQGARLTTFDVTDPSKIKFVSSIKLESAAPFDFVRPLGGSAELIRYRDSKGVAILELHSAKKPVIKAVSGLTESGSTQSLGESAFMMIDEPYNYVRAVPRDFQVIDISTPSDPVLLTTVKQVKHRLVKDDTGTTFLLGSDGLTVIRRPSVEEEYKTEQFQMSHN